LHLTEIASMFEKITGPGTTHLKNSCANHFALGSIGFAAAGHRSFILRWM